MLLSHSGSVLFTLSSLLSFHPSQTLWHIWQELFFSNFLSDYNGSPVTPFFRAVTRPMSCAAPALRFRVVSHLPDPLFSDWRRTVLSKFFDTSVLFVSAEELVLPRHVCCVRSRLRCHPHSLLLNSFSLDGCKNHLGRIENLSYRTCGHPALFILFCIVQVRTLSTAVWRVLFCLRPLFHALGSWLTSRAQWSPHPSEEVG